MVYQVLPVRLQVRHIIIYNVKIRVALWQSYGEP